MICRRATLTAIAFRSFCRAMNVPHSVTPPPGGNTRQVCSTSALMNRHGDELLQYLTDQGAMGMDLGPIHIQATRYIPGQSGMMDINDDPDTKIVHFQRHGQGYHNLVFAVLNEAGAPVLDVYDTDPKKNPFVRPEMVDAPLTELGREQCKAQRPNAAALRPEVVIVSPLHRALQTAQISFTDFRGKIPFIAHEALREELGLLVCNKRRPLSETMEDYPSIDFSIMAKTAPDEDIMWDPNNRENPQKQARRIYGFLADFLRLRPEKELAIVGHSAWLFGMCHVVLDCGQDDDLRAWFGTSEIRSMKLKFSNKT